MHLTLIPESCMSDNFIILRIIHLVPVSQLKHNS